MTTPSYSELLREARAQWPLTDHWTPRTDREDAILRIMCALIDKQAYATICTLKEMLYPTKENPTWTQVMNGLETIQKVLDYGTDSDQMRHNIMVWTKNAVRDLLAGREVKEPSRK